MEYDPNLLEDRAEQLVQFRRPRDAIKIYLFMADGDPSLDGGYLGERLGECYEALGDLHAARYWYGRAAEENPQVRTHAVESHGRLGTAILVEIETLIAPR